MSNQVNPTNVTTGQVRLSYVHLFQPYASPSGGEPKYSATILVPKSDVATKQRIDAAIQAAISAGVASRWNGIRPPQVSVPIHDGDGVRPSDGMPFGDECKGHWVVTASSKQQQAIVDMNLNPIINQTEVYSGMYARVNINFFPYANSGKKGIGCGLGPVQKISDGEPLGGRISAEAAFGAPMPQQPAYSAPAPAPAYQQPQYQQPAYPQAPAYGQPAGGYAQPAQPNYQQPAQQQPAFDPITGKPLSGGVMGL